MAGSGADPCTGARPNIFDVWARVTGTEHVAAPHPLRDQQPAWTSLGSVVAKFFDWGHSRCTAWPDRPQAAALFAALAHPDRGFDAVVVSEYERAFREDQLTQLLPLFARHGVQLWLPETHKPVDTADPAPLARCEPTHFVGINVSEIDSTTTPTCSTSTNTW